MEPPDRRGSTGWMAPRGLTIDRTTGRAYVAEGGGGGIHSFDYNTGVYYGRLDAGYFFDRYLVYKGGSVFATGGDLVRTNVSTGVQTTIGLPNLGGPAWIADYSASEILVSSFFSNTNSTIYRYNVITGQFTAISGVFNDPSSFFGDGTYITKFGPTGLPAAFAGSGAGGDLRRIDFAANGQFAGISAFNSANLNNCFGTTEGHAGIFACGKLAADSTKGGITFFDNFGTERQTYTYSNLYDPRGMASVVAPEPSTMIATTVGLAALVRRRRKG